MESRFDAVFFGLSIGERNARSDYVALRKEGAGLSLFAPLARTRGLPDIGRLPRNFPILPGGDTGRPAMRGRRWRRAAAMSDVAKYEITSDNILVTGYRGDLPIAIGGRGRFSRGSVGERKTACAPEDARPVSLEDFPLIGASVLLDPADMRNASEPAWRQVSDVLTPRPAR